MIKDVMVSLDGTPVDEVRLAAVADIAEHFESHITALFLNMLPPLVPAEWDGVGVAHAAQMMHAARENGNRIEAALRQRLATLQSPAKLRRIDLVAGSDGDIAAHEARSADVFVGLRPSGASHEADQLIESVLFGSGRHVFLAPIDRPAPAIFDRIVLAWNDTREATRAVAEAMPYLRKAEMVDVIVVQDSLFSPINGNDLMDHLLHHGVGAELHDVRPRGGGIGATLIAEAQERSADLIVIGGYGHSRLREWLLGGVTYQLMHQAPIPLIVAH
jgi:nucleotide-binding universal stress UspA family protein